MCLSSWDIHSSTKGRVVGSKNMTESPIESLSYLLYVQVMATPRVHSLSCRFAQLEN